MINPFYSIPSLASSAFKREKLDLSMKLERRVRREGNKVTYTYKVYGRPATRRKYCGELWYARRYSKWMGKMPPECRGGRRRKKKKKVKKTKEPENGFQKFRDALKKKGVILPPEDKSSGLKSDKKGRKEEAGGFIEENWLAGLVWVVAIGAVGVTWWLLKRDKGGDDDKTPPPPPVNPSSPVGRNSVMSTSVDASAKRSVMPSISPVMPGLSIGLRLFMNAIHVTPLRA
jgi:hypothetical protein